MYFSATVFFSLHVCLLYSTVNQTLTVPNINLTLVFFCYCVFLMARLPTIQYRKPKFDGTKHKSNPCLFLLLLEHTYSNFFTMIFFCPARTRALLLRSVVLVKTEGGPCCLQILSFIQNQNPGVTFLSKNQSFITVK